MKLCIKMQFINIFLDTAKFDFWRKNRDVSRTQGMYHVNDIYSFWIFFK